MFNVFFFVLENLESEYVLEIPEFTFSFILNTVEYVFYLCAWSGQFLMGKKKYMV